MAFLDISIHKRPAAEVEIGHECGQLATPLTQYAVWGDRQWIAENGMFSGCEVDEFARWLRRNQKHRANCIGVVVPDVVGSARRTLEVFRHWYPKLQHWPLLLVTQDGIEDLEIPWSLIAGVFTGGTDGHKLSDAAIHVGKAAKLMGKWWHVGRVNTANRWEKFEAAGADSCDGSGICQYTHMRHDVRDRKKQRLFNEDAA